MNKRDFSTFIKHGLKPLDATEQIKAMQKMKGWLDLLIDEKKKNRTLCSNCSKYSLTSKFKNLNEREIRHETIFSDCGYGDDDTHGEVEYLVTYQVCPLCGHKKETLKRHLHTISEYTRDGRRIH